MIFLLNKKKKKKGKKKYLIKKYIKILKDTK